MKSAEGIVTKLVSAPAGNSPEGALDEICRRQISFHDLVEGQHDLLCLVLREEEGRIILG